MRVARSIGGSGEPIESAKSLGKCYGTQGNGGNKCKDEKFNLLPQSVAYEIAVLLAFWTDGSSDDMI